MARRGRVLPAEVGVTDATAAERAELARGGWVPSSRREGCWDSPCGKLRDAARELAGTVMRFVLGMGPAAAEEALDGPEGE